MYGKRCLKFQADKLWFQKYLDECCEVCGSNYVLQGHHFYYRSSYSHLRYDPDNHITLCKKCHFKLHHQDPKSIEDIIIKVRGRKWLNRLKKKALSRPTSSYQTISYYKSIIKGLNE